jgi:hypothetical protein
MIFSPNTIRNSAFAEPFLKQYRKQKLKLLSGTHWLDEVGDYSGTQRPKYVLESDGSAVINSSHITNQTVVSKKGTATATVSTGQIAVGSGWISEIVLSDGTVYFLEESSGTNFYDSSGAGHNATLTGTGTWAIKRNLTLINNANLYGYTLTGSVIIPVDLSNLALNAEGDALQFVGRVASDMKFIQSNKGEVGITNDYGQFNFDCTGVTIVSKEGQTTVNINQSNNRLIFTGIGNGSIYHIVLSNGLTFPIAEGRGVVSYAENDSTKTLTWFGNFDWSTQDTYHHNITQGFTEGVNHLPFSETQVFGNESVNNWTEFGSQVITTNNLDAFGTNTAFSSTLNVASGHFDIYRRVQGLTANVEYTFSLYVKLGTATDLAVTVNTTLAWNSLPYNRIYTTADGLNTSTFTRIDYNFTPTTSRVNLHIGKNAQTNPTAPQSTGTVFFCFAQIQKGSVSTPYQKTVLSATEGVKLPYKISGAYSNAATNGHNQPRTKLKQVVFREDFGASSLHFDQSDLSSEVITYADIANTANVFVNQFPNVKINLETFFPSGIINQTNRQNNGLRRNKDTFFGNNK